MDTSNYYHGLNNNRHHNNMGSSSVTQAAAAAAAIAAGMIGIGNNNNNNNINNNNSPYGNCGNNVNSNNYGYYNNQQQQQQQQPQQDNISGYMPNYYQIDNNNGYDNIGQQYHQRIDQHQMTTRHYYEPLFRPPPTSCYAHSYSRHNVDPNPSFIAPPPGQPLTLSTSSSSSTSSSASSQSVPHIGGWYQQQQQIAAGQYEQTLNMLQYSNSNGREARNKAEKNRRDKLNGSIQELSTMVPHVAESPRRVDKTAVLRFSAHGLRIHYVFGKTVNKQPAVKSQVTDALMRLLDSFLLSITCRGQIVLISPSIEQHLGHCQTDLFGQNILHITHPDDHLMLKKQLIPTDLETLFDIQPEDENGEPRPRTQEEEEEIDRKLREDRRNFTVRLARAGPRSEPTTYEIVKIDGCFRRADSAPRGVKSSTFPSGLQLIRRARGRDDSIPLHSISGNDVILVAMARVIKPPKICDRLIEANHYEYKTRHLIDGRIIQCDQRISLVAGYMTEEVNGLSPFTFMHQDDVRWVIVALRQMYDCNSAYGESCYRLITRTGKFIYLRTRGYLEIDKDTNKVHSFVCINTLVSEDEGRRRVQEMKNKFSIIINTKIPPSAIDAPASENPHQLEKAVIYLIKNLRKCDDDDDDDDEDDDDEDDGDGVEISSRGSHHGGSESDSNRQSKTPPLALIPPKTCTIKSSISKSVNVVNMSVAKGLKAQQAKSPSSASESDSRESIDMMAMSTGSGKSIDNNSNSDGGCCINTNENQYSNRPSVVRKNGDNLINANENIENRVPPLPNSKDYFETNLSNNLQQLQQHQHDQSSGSSGIETATTPRGDCMYSPISSIDLDKPSSVLKRSRTSDDFEDDTDIMIKRRNLGDSDFFLDTPSLEEFTDPNDNLTQILSSDPFDDIEQSLTDIESATTDLTDQCCSFDIGTSSSTSHRLNDILSEQQEQREILESIQNEYNSSNLLHHHNTSSSIDPRLISPKDCKTNCGLQNSGDFKTR